MNVEFQEFPKIARLSRECVITEKLDGTNAAVLIVDGESDVQAPGAIAKVGNLDIYAQSRSRFIQPGNDNYGFAAWVAEHAEELAGLGVGRHFGEWWGMGIQRRYGLTVKRFSLFNTIRWCEHGAQPGLISSHDSKAEPKYQTPVPACCDVVPVLYRGLFHTDEVEDALEVLHTHGSLAAPGFMQPEGVVVFHTGNGACFKKTLEKDALPKSLAA